MYIKDPVIDQHFVQLAIGHDELTNSKFYTDSKNGNLNLQLEKNYIEYEELKTKQRELKNESDSEQEELEQKEENQQHYATKNKTDHYNIVFFLQLIRTAIPDVI